ncbi:hypothetical protein HG535_0B06670 [Zygotorulaspora mrakii]|uniref:Uncharacterized protein n=1 Tax=Zygotorulaspora mrakii TaxID=42260 RepID=A0A7H9AZ62_ZYGMR|nr:uncharacterized protein HG535_0B06670 [Zygotorulaspora mrakii]QLG71621.1 hypothetical protein HG535_0B06670 [Zygotorulaspora mrakii]
MNAGVYDADEAYRQTQSQIYKLQETLLNSTRTEQTAGQRHSDDVQSAEPEEAALTSATQKAGGISEVDSGPVLTYIFKEYGCSPSQDERVATLAYHPYAEGRMEGGTPKAVLPFPYDTVELSTPRPFLPGYGRDKINRLVTVKIAYEDLKNSCKHFNSPRALNNEIWGCQIYTDDSDPVLVLRHCGVSIDEDNGTGTCRTPANMNNTDNITGTIPPEGTPFDLEVDLLLLPTLQTYESVMQHGIYSKYWGGRAQAPHDGLSYGIYGIRVMTRDTSTQNINTDEHQITPASNWAL